MPNLSSALTNVTLRSGPHGVSINLFRADDQRIIVEVTISGPNGGKLTTVTDLDGITTLRVLKDALTVFLNNMDEETTESALAVF